MFTVTGGEHVVARRKGDGLVMVSATVLPVGETFVAVGSGAGKYAVLVEVEPEGAPVVVALYAEFVVAGYLGGEGALEERHVVVVAIDSVAVVLPVVVVVEVVTAIAGTGLEHTLARRGHADETAVVGEVEVGGGGRDHEALHLELVGVLDYGVNITDLGLVRPSHGAFGPVGETPVYGYVHPGRLLGKVNGNAIGVGGVFVRVSGVLVA